MWFLQKQGGLRKIMFAGWGPVKLQQEIVSLDGMRRSIPDHGSRKLPVINALYGAIPMDKEIDP